MFTDLRLIGTEKKDVDENMFLRCTSLYFIIVRRYLLVGNMNVTFSISSVQILLDETRKMEIVQQLHSRDLFFIYSFIDLKALL